MGKPGANLTLANLKNELPKAKRLAKDGLATDYVILTNAGISGEADSEICAAFEAVGVQRCQVFGGSWIEQQLEESVRLRMLVPRVYGIGDLSHVITGHAYKQAKAILDNMGSDLSCFVPTDAYRDAVKALHEHRFVMLLGDPASGKSTIAAILALGALDDGCIGALKINGPDQLNLWHPGEAQLLWVDDAFGPNHFDVDRMSRWNAELGTLRAAIEGGARIIFTSRNYIWGAARPYLKRSAFPLLKESQVVVNVQELSENERAQMLYNHVRRVHTKSMRQRLKPFLPAVAANKAFLPETARRLGDPLFTRRLTLSAGRLKELVEHPVEFLTEVLEQLDGPLLGAIALIFLNSESGVPSPIGQHPALEMVTRLLGVQTAAVAKAMENLNDSLTRRISAADGDRWVFRHPTVTDAFAEIVARSPELIELYVHGAKVDRLVREVVCAPLGAQNAHVRVPTALFPVLLERFQERVLDESFKAFLGARAGDKFLRQITNARPDILEWAETTLTNDLSSGSLLLLAGLNSYGLLPDHARTRIVERVDDDAITWMQTKAFVESMYSQIFSADELDTLAARFRKEWLTDLTNLLDELRGRFSSDNELGLYEEFKDNMEKAETFFFPDGRPEDLEIFYSDISVHIGTLEEEEPPSAPSTWSGQATTSASISAASTAADSGTIFDDVDD
jgi:energy-coupling factor transporter ATP-binding protein EcfA2